MPEMSSMLTLIIFTSWWWCQEWDLREYLWENLKAAPAMVSEKQRAKVPPLTSVIWMAGLHTAEWRKAWCHLAKWFIVILLKWLAGPIVLVIAAKAAFPKTDSAPHTHSLTCIHSSSEPPSFLYMCCRQRLWEPEQIAAEVERGDAVVKHHMTVFLYAKSRQKHLNWTKIQ